MSQLEKLTRDNALLLVIDLQEKLLPAMHERDACLAAAEKLIRASEVLNIPILATEQYPAGLGPTCQPIRQLLTQQAPFEKMLFSACTEQVKQAIAATGRRQLILTGIEAHVCVQQTALDLLRDGFTVYLCVDGVTSRRPLDRQTAIERLRAAGAIITTAESAIFELLGQAGTEEFRKVLKFVK